VAADGTARSPLSLTLSDPSPWSLGKAAGERRASLLSRAEPPSESGRRDSLRRRLFCPKRPRLKRVLSSPARPAGCVLRRSAERTCNGPPKAKAHARHHVRPSLLKPQAPSRAKLQAFGPQPARRCRAAVDVAAKTNHPHTMDSIPPVGGWPRRCFPVAGESSATGANPAYRPLSPDLNPVDQMLLLGGWPPRGVHTPPGKGAEHTRTPPNVSHTLSLCAFSDRCRRPPAEQRALDAVLLAASDAVSGRTIRTHSAPPDARAMPGAVFQPAPRPQARRRHPAARTHSAPSVSVFNGCRSAPARRAAAVPAPAALAVAARGREPARSAPVGPSGAGAPRSSIRSFHDRASAANPEADVFLPSPEPGELGYTAGGAAWLPSRHAAGGAADAFFWGKAAEGREQPAGGTGASPPPALDPLRWGEGTPGVWAPAVEHAAGGFQQRCRARLSPPPARSPSPAASGQGSPLPVPDRPSEWTAPQYRLASSSSGSVTARRCGRDDGVPPLPRTADSGCVEADGSPQVQPPAPQKADAREAEDEGVQCFRSTGRGATAKQALCVAGPAGETDGRGKSAGTADLPAASCGERAAEHEKAPTAGMCPSSSGASERLQATQEERREQPPPGRREETAVSEGQVEAPRDGSQPTHSPQSVLDEPTVTVPEQNDEEPIRAGQPDTTRGVDEEGVAEIDILTHEPRSAPVRGPGWGTAAVQNAENPGGETGAPDDAESEPCAPASVRAKTPPGVGTTARPGYRVLSCDGDSPASSCGPTPPHNGGGAGAGLRECRSGAAALPPNELAEGVASALPPPAATATRDDGGDPAGSELPAHRSVSETASADTRTGEDVEGNSASVCELFVPTGPEAPGHIECRPYRSSSQSTMPPRKADTPAGEDVEGNSASVCELFVPTGPKAPGHIECRPYRSSSQSTMPPRKADTPAGEDVEGNSASVCELFVPTGPKAPGHIERRAYRSSSQSTLPPPKADTPTIEDVASNSESVRESVVPTHNGAAAELSAYRSASQSTLPRDEVQLAPSAGTPEGNSARGSHATADPGSPEVGVHAHRSASQSTLPPPKKQAQLSSSDSRSPPRDWDSMNPSRATATVASSTDSGSPGPVVPADVRRCCRRSASQATIPPPSAGTPAQREDDRSHSTARLPREPSAESAGSQVPEAPKIEHFTGELARWLAALQHPPPAALSTRDEAASDAGSRATRPGTGDGLPGGQGTDPSSQSHAHPIIEGSRPVAIDAGVERQRTPDADRINQPLHPLRRQVRYTAEESGCLAGRYTNSPTRRKSMPNLKGTEGEATEPASFGSQIAHHSLAVPEPTAGPAGAARAVSVASTMSTASHKTVAGPPARDPAPHAARGELSRASAGDLAAAAAAAAYKSNYEWVSPSEERPATPLAAAAAYKSNFECASLSEERTATLMAAAAYTSSFECVSPSEKGPATLAAAAHEHVRATTPKQAARDAAWLASAAIGTRSPPHTGGARAADAAAQGRAPTRAFDGKGTEASGGSTPPHRPPASRNRPKHRARLSPRPAHDNPSSAFCSPPGRCRTPAGLRGGLEVEDASFTPQSGAFCAAEAGGLDLVHSPPLFRSKGAACLSPRRRTKPEQRASVADHEPTEAGWTGPPSPAGTQHARAEGNLRTEGARHKTHAAQAERTGCGRDLRTGRRYSEGDSPSRLHAQSASPTTPHDAAKGNRACGRLQPDRTVGGGGSPPSPAGRRGRPPARGDGSPAARGGAACGGGRAPEKRASPQLLAKAHAARGSARPSPVRRLLVGTPPGVKAWLEDGAACLSPSDDDADDGSAGTSPGRQVLAGAPFGVKTWLDGGTVCLSPRAAPSAGPACGSPKTSPGGRLLVGTPPGGRAWREDGTAFLSPGGDDDDGDDSARTSPGREVLSGVPFGAGGTVCLSPRAGGGAGAGPSAGPARGSPRTSPGGRLLVGTPRGGKAWREDGTACLSPSDDDDSDRSPPAGDAEAHDPTSPLADFYAGEPPAAAVGLGGGEKLELLLQIARLEQEVEKLQQQQRQQRQRAAVPARSGPAGAAHQHAAEVDREVARRCAAREQALAAESLALKQDRDDARRAAAALSQQLRAVQHSPAAATATAAVATQAQPPTAHRGCQAGARRAPVAHAAVQAAAGPAPRRVAAAAQTLAVDSLTLTAQAVTVARYPSPFPTADQCTNTQPDDAAGSSFELNAHQPDERREQKDAEGVIEFPSDRQSAVNAIEVKSELSPVLVPVELTGNRRTVPTTASERVADVSPIHDHRSGIDAVRVASAQSTLLQTAKSKFSRPSAAVPTAQPLGCRSNAKDRTPTRAEQRSTVPHKGGSSCSSREKWGSLFSPSRPVSPPVDVLPNQAWQAPEGATREPTEESGPAANAPHPTPETAPSLPERIVESGQGTNESGPSPNQQQPPEAAQCTPSGRDSKSGQPFGSPRDPAGEERHPLPEMTTPRPGASRISARDGAAADEAGAPGSPGTTRSAQSCRPKGEEVPGASAAGRETPRGCTKVPQPRSRSAGAAGRAAASANQRRDRQPGEKASDGPPAVQLPPPEPTPSTPRGDRRTGTGRAGTPEGVVQPASGAGAGQSLQSQRASPTLPADKPPHLKRLNAGHPRQGTGSGQRQRRASGGSPAGKRRAASPNLQVPVSPAGLGASPGASTPSTKAACAGHRAALVESPTGPRASSPCTRGTGTSNTSSTREGHSVSPEPFESAAEPNVTSGTEHVATSGEFESSTRNSASSPCTLDTGTRNATRISKGHGTTDGSPVVLKASLPCTTGVNARESGHGASPASSPAGERCVQVRGPSATTDGCPRRSTDSPPRPRSDDGVILPTSAPHPTPKSSPSKPAPRSSSSSSGSCNPAAEARNAPESPRASQPEVATVLDWVRQAPANLPAEIASALQSMVLSAHGTRQSNTPSPLPLLPRVNRERSSSSSRAAEVHCIRRRTAAFRLHDPRGGHSQYVGAPTPPHGEDMEVQWQSRYDDETEANTSYGRQGEQFGESLADGESPDPSSTAPHWQTSQAPYDDGKTSWQLGSQDREDEGDLYVAQVPLWGASDEHAQSHVADEKANRYKQGRQHAQYFSDFQIGEDEGCPAQVSAARLWQASGEQTQMRHSDGEQPDCYSPDGQTVRATTQSERSPDISPTGMARVWWTRSSRGSRPRCDDEKEASRSQTAQGTGRPAGSEEPAARGEPSPPASPPRLAGPTPPGARTVRAISAEDLPFPPSAQGRHRPLLPAPEQPPAVDAADGLPAQKFNLAGWSGGVKAQAPNSGFQAPKSGYQASNTTGYQAPNSTGYQAPNSGDQAPNPGYQAPKSGYQASNSGDQASNSTGYQAPNSGYQAPKSGYQAPNSTGYQASNSGDQTPNAGYQAPNSGHQVANSGYRSTVYRSVSRSPSGRATRAGEASRSPSHGPRPSENPMLERMGIPKACPPPPPPPAPSAPRGSSYPLPRPPPQYGELPVPRSPPLPKPPASPAFSSAVHQLRSQSAEPRGYGSGAPPAPYPSRASRPGAGGGGGLPAASVAEAACDPRSRGAQGPAQAAEPAAFSCVPPGPATAAIEGQRRHGGGVPRKTQPAAVEGGWCEIPRIGPHCEHSGGARFSEGRGPAAGAGRPFATSRVDTLVPCASHGAEDTAGLVARGARPDATQQRGEAANRFDIMLSACVGAENDVETAAPRGNRLDTAQPRLEHPEGRFHDTSARTTRRHRGEDANRFDIMLSACVGAEKHADETAAFRGNQPRAEHPEGGRFRSASARTAGRHRAEDADRFDKLLGVCAAEWDAAGMVAPCRAVTGVPAGFDRGDCQDGFAPLPQPASRPGLAGGPRQGQAVARTAAAAQLSGVQPARGRSIDGGRESERQPGPDRLRSRSRGSGGDAQQADSRRGEAVLEPERAGVRGSPHGGRFDYVEYEAHLRHGIGGRCRREDGGRPRSSSSSGRVQYADNQEFDDEEYEAHLRAFSCANLPRHGLEGRGKDERPSSPSSARVQRTEEFDREEYEAHLRALSGANPRIGGDGSNGHSVEHGGIRFREEQKTAPAADGGQQRGQDSRAAPFQQQSNAQRAADDDGRSRRRERQQQQQAVGGWRRQSEREADADGRIRRGDTRHPARSDPPQTVGSADRPGCQRDPPPAPGPGPLVESATVQAGGGSPAENAAQTPPAGIPRAASVKPLNNARRTASADPSPRARVARSPTAGSRRKPESDARGAKQANASSGSPAKNNNNNTTTTTNTTNNNINSNNNSNHTNTNNNNNKGKGCVTPRKHRPTKSRSRTPSSQAAVAVAVARRDRHGRWVSPQKDGGKPPAQQPHALAALDLSEAGTRARMEALLATACDTTATSSLVEYDSEGDTVTPQALDTTPQPFLTGSPGSSVSGVDPNDPFVPNSSPAGPDNLSELLHRAREQRHILRQEREIAETDRASECSPMQLSPSSDLSPLGALQRTFI
ncbi:hypothetical protein DIPPA_05686, partial [Diplonema papillatum]